MAEQSKIKTLLAKGYFPKELPPVFTTADFGQHAEPVIADWAAAKLFKRKAGEKVPGGGKKKKQGSYTYDLYTPELEAISCPKRGYERRNVHITHPIPQALLASEIDTNWKKIAAWLARAKYSIDQVQISSKHSRGLRPLNFETHRARKAYIEASADWIVKTDVTRFYPSIYTHSIPWAAYGKEAVKRKIGLYKGSLGDRLDILVRSCNRGQTVGLPIGPETSRILADIISARIECDFSAKGINIDPSQVDRLQDDWFLGASTLDVAESALAGIASCYRAYGLDINGSKTAVERTISPLSETWIAEIGAFLSHSTAALTRARLREFLHLALKLQLDYPKDSVVGYALSVIESRRSSIHDVEALESFLIRAAAVAPAALSRICSILINLQHDTKRVSVARVRSRFTKLLERNVANDNLYEVIWLLFTLRGLKVSLNSRLFCDALEKISSSALILLALEMKDKNLIWNKLPVTAWENGIDGDRILTDWSWLYAYEGIRKGWLNDRQSVMKHLFFKALASRNIVFYDPRRNVARTKKTVELRRRQRKKNTRDAQQLIAALRGFEFGDYEDF